MSAEAAAFTPYPILDHIVILVPSLANSDIAFLTGNGFELRPGGVSANGFLQNRFVVFSDGCYIEVVTYTSKATGEGRASHWWGAKKYGWIDWAISATPSGAVAKVNALNKGREGDEVYNPANEGGRGTAEGKFIRWRSGFPVLKDGELRGVLPILSEDLNDRSWRVLPRPTPQPNSATGVKSITLLSKPGQLSAYRARLSHVLGPAMTLSTFHGGNKIISVIVREPASETELDWVKDRGEGVWEVELTSTANMSIHVGALEGARIKL
ncbi:hypothetical protein T439DRAFT_349290 [Meredithblackwellia eburnea MCA 4105]